MHLIFKKLEIMRQNSLENCADLNFLSLGKIARIEIYKFEKLRGLKFTNLKNYAD